MAWGSDLRVKLRKVYSETIYKTLDRSLHQIRLLHVLPGEPGSPISCDLSIASLSDKPQYEALSYVWGSRKNKGCICLRNKKIKVTTNLLSALDAIRLPDRGRIILVDALCINQDDRKERGQQKVIAWLDHDPEDGELAFDVLEALSESSDLHLDDRMSPHLDSELLDPESIASLIRLFDCDWWRRVWTFQEMVLATELEFRCGERSLTGQKLAEAYSNFWEHNTCCYSAFSGEYPGHPLADLDKYFGRLTRIYDIGNLTQDIVYPAIMMVFRQRECTDPRDKVFGYLGLSFGRFKNFIEPNYHKTPAQVREETAIQIMQKIESLGPLSLLEGPKSEGYRCPSWVPTFQEFEHDFIFETYYIRFSWLIGFNACRKKSLDISLVCAGKLKVRGVIVATVASIGKVPPNHPIKHQTPIYDEWYQLAQCSTRTPYRDGKATRPEAFWLTLLNGPSNEPPEAPLLSEEDESHTTHTLDKANPGSNDSNTPLPGFSSAVESAARPLQNSNQAPSPNVDPPTPTTDLTTPRSWRKWWTFMHAKSDYLDPEGMEINTRVTAATVNRAFFITKEGHEREKPEGPMRGQDRGQAQVEDEAGQKNIQWHNKVDGGEKEEEHSGVDGGNEAQQQEEDLWKKEEWTESGQYGSWMGTGPAKMRPGDLVVVLFGGLVPYVIRHAGGMARVEGGRRVDEYIILGDCYLHGIMHGEAIDAMEEGVYREQEFVLV